MATNTPSLTGVHKICIPKENDRFGLSFQKLENGTYRITDASGTNLNLGLQVGDILLAVNGVTSSLEIYCNSPKAHSLSTWNLEVTKHEATESLGEISSIPSSTGSLELSLLTFAGPRFNSGKEYSELVASALDKPVCIIWSNEVQVHYQAASLIINSVKFKKKKSNAQHHKKWVMVKEIYHSTSIDPLQRVLEPGDWLISIDDRPVPFEPSSGFTIWFKNLLTQRKDQPITFTIKKPTAKLTNNKFERTFSINTVRPSIAQSYNPSDMFSLVEPDPLSTHRQSTSSPEFLRKGTEMLHKTRTSIQVKIMERLCRYRIIFHGIGKQATNHADQLRLQIFENNITRSSCPYGGIVNECHVHACFSETESMFLPADCNNSAPIDGVTCSYEMHETVERIFEKAAIQGESREFLLNMPDHVSDGPLSFGSLRRFSNLTEFDRVSHRMHLEILSLTGPNTELLNPWLSPLIFCKHSMNVVVIDAQAFSCSRELELKLSNLLDEIHTYTRSVNQTNSISLDGKVLLVLSNVGQEPDGALISKINKIIRPHQDRLVLTSPNQYPFALCSEIAAIRSRLLGELKNLSENALKTAPVSVYPYIAVMLSQKNNKEGFRFIETNDIEEQLRALNDGPEVDQANFEIMFSGTLQYLHNAGLAYVSDLSYSKSIGKACATIRHSLLIHPHRICDALYTLSVGQYSQVEQGTVSDANLKRVLNCVASEKIISIMKELHVVLPTNSNDQFQFPLISKFQQGNGPSVPVALPALDMTPNLIMSYKGNRCLLLITAFLNELSLKARTSNINYHSSVGRFDLFDCDVCVLRTVNTKWSQLKCVPIPAADHSLSFFLISLNSEKTSKRVFVKNLVDLINNFNKSFKRPHQTVFGPPCPLVDSCVERPFHAINILDQTPLLSCSGVNLEKTESVTDYVWQGVCTNIPDSNARREEILNRSAYTIPKKILEVLDCDNILGRNWIGLAKERNFSQRDIDELGKQESPTYCLLFELSHQGYAIKHLLLSLNENEMERIDVVHDITEWIDLELVQMSR
ncbi:hypothetical protein EB796_022757 [Bugula neritina]|uniref:Uncharacterized protein n=1 Tax=Bugula neritina TaxID=10212 RepID=A0A7J7IZG6_BUGNE|nr:hypothetical protein EB796_022757 [Bugula neritina]